MRALRAWPVASSVIILALLAGCGNPEMTTVTGTVTFDGQPVPEGDILFQPSEARYGPDAGKIKDGKFKLQVRPGKKKVEIRAVRPVPGKKGPMGEDAFEDYIPAKYNDKTTLTRDVTAGGRNEFTFDLTSK